MASHAKPPERSATERDRFRAALADVLRSLSTPGEIQAEAARLLAEHLGVERVFYGELDADGGSFVIERSHGARGAATLEGRYPLAAIEPGLLAELAKGRVIAIDDFAEDRMLPSAQRAAHRAFGISAGVGVPLAKDGRWVALLGVHDRDPHDWSAAELALIEETAERTWAAVERARAERTLRASEEGYRALFASIDEALCIVEILRDEAGRPCDGRLLEANPAFVAMTAIESPVGRTVAELTHDVRDFWIDTYAGVALTGEPVRFERRVPSGRWYDVYCTRIGDPRDLRVAVVFDDISARKEAEETLREADRRKDEFLATLSHELRNPLAPMQNALAILREGGSDAAGFERTIAMMERQVGQMVRLIDDLLDVSRISRGVLSLRRTPTELGALLEQAVEACQTLFASAGLAVHVELPDAPLRLLADPLRLDQVFGNLLNNAAKFTERGGRITLRAARDGSDAVVSITDTGIGIPARELEHIFEMFAQVDTTLERREAGLGIGLTLVKRLVELHDGSVTAKSDGPGRGSEFVVRLPALDAEVEAVAPSLKSTPAPAPRRSILIVDDNADSAESLALLLQLRGNDTHTANDGEAAVEAAARLRPDVILLDIGMPRLNGYEACRRIRALPGSRNAVIIAMTGWGQEEDRRRSSEAGFDGHLVKPVDQDALAELLRAAPSR